MRDATAASEIRVYIQDDSHDKENIEDRDDIQKTSSEQSVNSQELEETPQKKKPITKRLLGKMGNAAPDITSNRRNRILPLLDE